MTDSKVFLITGCSSGLGLILVRKLLQCSEHKVIATSRDPSKTPELVAEVESKGGSWLQLDATDADLDSKVGKAVAVHGRVDVLINNAGIGRLAVFENQSMEDVRLVMETNFFGPLRLIHAVLPGMRQQHSGTIINMSSASAYWELPGMTMYASSKSALDTFTASLAAEVACHGIRVVVAIPGLMPTPMILDKERREPAMAPVPEPYKGTPVHGVYTELFTSFDVTAKIDTEKAADRLIEAALGTGMLKGRTQKLVRLPIGSDIGTFMGQWGTEFLKNVGRFEDVWSSVESPAVN